MNKQVLLLLTSFLISGISFSQVPFKWSTVFPSAGNDWPYAIDELADNNLVIFGKSEAELLLFNEDGRVALLSPTGETIWDKTFGGSEQDEFFTGITTSDGGFIAGGRTHSTDGTLASIGSINGISDGWLVKLDASGNTMWQQTLGAEGQERIESIKETPDGGYILAGWSNSTVFVFGGGLAWAIKVDAAGNVMWEKRFGSTDAQTIPSNWFADVVVAPDGGYYFAGYTSANPQANGIPANNYGSIDGWVVKLDEQGDLLWEKNYGGTNQDQFDAMELAPDGSLYVTGYSFSDDIDLPGNLGNRDLWVCNISANGDLIWSKNYGGDYIDHGYGMDLTSDGGIVIAGVNGSSYDENNLQSWLLKLDASGDIEWNQEVGGSSSEYAQDVVQTADGDFALTARSTSDDGDVGQNYGGRDWWAYALQNPDIPVLTDLELYTTLTNTDPAIYSTVSITFTVTNAGQDPATGIVVNIPKPDGVVYSGGNAYTATQGTLNTFSTNDWDIGILQAYTSASLTVNYFLLVEEMPVVYAQVVAANETDVDSSPGNGTPPTVNEDDEASVFNSVGNSILTVDCPADFIADLSDCFQLPDFEVSSDLEALPLVEPTATTTCSDGIVNVELLPNPDIELTFFPFLYEDGIYDVEYRITDACGNEEICAYTITVIAMPTYEQEISCPENIVVAAPAGAEGLVVEYEFPTVTNNCCFDLESLSLSEGLESGELFPIGTTEVIYTTDNPCIPNSDICSFTVTVLEESLGLTVDCPEDFIVDRSTCVIPAFGPQCPFPENAELIEPIAVTTCPEGGVTIELLDSLNYRICQDDAYVEGDGVYNIQYRITDACGNEEICSYTLNLIGFPSGFNNITCPDDIVVQVPIGSTGAIVEYDLPIIESNCCDAGSSVTILPGSLPSGSEFPIGTSTVWYNYRNFCTSPGGGISCNFTITVEEVENPTSGIDLELTMTSNPTTVNAFGYVDLTLTLENKGDQIATNIITKLNQSTDYVLAGDGSPILSAGDFSSFTQEWNLATLATGESETLTLRLFTLSDEINPCAEVIAVDQTDIDSSPANGTCPTVNEDDEANLNNTSAGELTINCPANYETGGTGCYPQFIGFPVEPSINIDLVEPMATTTCPGGIVNIEYLQTNNNIVPAMDGLPARAQGGGDYVIEYRITDACGNEELCSYTITVISFDLVVDPICPDDIVVTVSAGSNGTVVDFQVDFNSNCCTTFSVNVEPASGSFFPVGTTQVNAFIDEGCTGGQGCSFNVIVEEEGSSGELTVECPNSFIENFGGCVAPFGPEPPCSLEEAVELIEPVATTTCSGGIVSIELLDSADYDFCNSIAYVTGDGIYDIQYRVTDACGNEEICNYTITVLPYPQLNFSITCRDDIIIEVPNGTTETVVNYELPVVQTNCCDIGEGAVLISGLESGSEFPIGTTNVTYSYTSPCSGGSLGCSFNVIITEADVQGDGIDLELSMTSDPTSVNAFNYVDLTLTLENKGNETATNIITKLNQSSDYVLAGDGSPVFSTGSFSSFTQEWSVASIVAGQSETLTLRIFTLANEINPCAEVIAADQGDIDSSPANGTCPTVNEDDEASLLGGNVNGTLTVECPEDFTEDYSESGCYQPNPTQGPNLPVVKAILVEPTATTTCPGGIVNIELLPNPDVIVGTGFFNFDYILGAGVYSVDYRITDACGNEEICSYTITIIDQVPFEAAITCPENIIITVPAGAEGAMVEYELPSLYTNCCVPPQAPVLRLGLESGSFFPVGSTEVIYTIFNRCVLGDYVCTFNIIVEESDSGFSCPDNLIVNGDFEDGFNDWFGINANPNDIDVYAGDISLEVVNPISGGGTALQLFDATPGNIYTLEFWAKSFNLDSDGSAFSPVELAFFDSTQQFSILSDNVIIDLTDDYQLYTISLEAPANTVIARIKVDAGIEQAVLIDNVCITETIAEPKPDLTIINPSVDEIQTVGGQVNYAYFVENIGDSSTVSSFVGNVYYSVDDVLSSDDILEGSFTFNPLAVGETQDLSGVSGVPVELTPGSYYFIFKADAGDDIDESDEDNNTVAIPITIVDPNQEYCDVESDFPWHEWISKVQINNQFAFPSGKTSYSDFTTTAPVADLELGRPFGYIIDVTYSYFTYFTYIHVYTDFNANGIFEDDEFSAVGISPIPNGNNVVAIRGGSDVVPDDAVLGPTRTRIIISRSPIVDACTDIAFGEVEDYTVNIVPANNSQARQNQIVSEDILIYPNPVGDELTVDLSSIDKAERVSIYNSLGHLQTEITLDESLANSKIQINTSEMMNGTYLMRVSGKEMRDVSKVFLVLRTY